MPDLSVDSIRVATAAFDAPRAASPPTLAALDLPAPMLLFDAGLRIQWLGGAASRELRLDAGQATGRDWHELFPDSRAPAGALAELLRGARDLLELPRIAVPGHGAAPRHFSVALRLLRGGEDEAPALLGVATDITERVSEDAALRTSEQRFRAISEHSRDLIIVCSREGQIQFVSSALESVSGERPERRLGGSIFDRLHPEDAKHARASIGRLAQDAGRGIATRLELRIVAADGDWRWIECTAANLLGHPAVRGIVLNCRDVTDRKRAEAALAAADTRLDTALRTSRTAYWSIDVGADRVAMSPHFFELTGISREQWEAEPHPWYARTHPDDYAVVHRAYEDCLAGQGEFYECDYRLRTPSGWMWLHDRGHVAERDDAGRPRTIAGTSQDASWRKRMEQALLESARSERRQLNDELHDGLGQELSGVQFMLAGIATQLRRDGSPQAAEVELTLALIGQALATTRSISRGLEPSNPKSGGLRAALQQLAADLSAAHGTDICFEAPDPTLPTVPDPAADHLFRMAREALIDACQRGGMGVVLGVHEAGGALEVSIVDAGPAQVAGVERSPDLGLRILAYRARMIGAQLHHAAGPPGRRCLRIRYPLAAWQDAGRA